MALLVSSVVKAAETQTTSENRRNYFRLPLINHSCRLKLALKNQQTNTSWGSCQLMNVSAGGAQISTVLDIPQVDGLEIVLSFKLHHMYQLKATLVWKEVKNGKHYYGCEWADMTDRTRDQLAREIVQVQFQSRRNKLIG